MSLARIAVWLGIGVVVAYGGGATVALAFWHTPVATALIVGTFLSLAAVVMHMIPPGGGAHGTP